MRAPPIGGRSGFESPPPHMKVKITKPINKQLNEKFGGYWKHIPFQSIWICDELDGFACFFAEGGYDVNGVYTPQPSFLRRLKVVGLEDGIKYLNL